MPITPVWKDVPDTNGKWQASNYGRLRRRGFGLVTPSFSEDQRYERVTINGHTKTVGTVILETFVGPRPEGMDCCHKDDNRMNNVLSNLRWDTRENNMMDCLLNGNGHRNPKMTASRVVLARLLNKMFPKVWSRKMLAKVFEVPASTMINAINYNTWTHLP